MRFFQLSLFTLFFAPLAHSTVAPDVQELAGISHLIIEGRITSISQVPYRGIKSSTASESDPKTELKIVVTVEKTIKGDKQKEISFYYPDDATNDKGHLFKPCVGKKVCAEFSKEKSTFYLLDRSKDERYSKFGASGYMLTDGWFGIQ